MKLFVFSIALLVLLAASSIALAAVEAAFYLLKRRRLSHVAMQNPRAEMANRYLEDPPTLLMPVHIGTFTAHTAMTVVLTSLLLDPLAHWAVPATFAAMMAYLLLFRLTLPYALVRRNPERSLLVLLPVFNLYAQAMRPLVTALRKRAEGETPPELEDTAVPEVPPPPVHDQDEVRLVSALAKFSETQVREVMTPRPDIVAIQSTASVSELRNLMRETKYSRIPVFGENLDDIVGVVEVRDLIDYDGDPHEPVQPLSKQVFLVPETKKIAELLRELQAQRTTFAVVIDEYGGTAGLVSVEDIVEELVGEIKDEYDVEQEPIVVEEGGAILVAGRVSLDRLSQALETSFGESAEVGTVGGLVTALFGRIPRTGDSIEHNGFVIEVVDAERKRVNQVRVRRKPAHEAAS
jgi:CBS domain containing-hemolysin-like protein